MSRIICKARNDFTCENYSVIPQIYVLFIISKHFALNWLDTIIWPIYDQGLNFSNILLLDLFSFYVCMWLVGLNV